MWQRGKEIKKQEDVEARERSAAKYRASAKMIESGANALESKPVEPGPQMLTPGGQGQPATPTSVPLPTIQALIANKPSVLASLFGGYVPRG